MKINLVVIAVLLPAILLAQDTALVKPSGELIYPDAESFKSANEIAPREKYFRVYVDTSPTIAYRSGEKIDFFASDCELKFVDASSGDFKYWFSTVGDNVDIGYSTHDKRDPSARAYFQCPDILGTNPKAWIDFRPDIFSSIFEQAKALSGIASPEIAGILIEVDTDANLQDGTEIGDIFKPENPNLKPSVARLDALGFELASSGKQRWRIANITSSATKLSDGGNGLMTFTPWRSVWYPQYYSFNSDSSVSFSGSHTSVFFSTAALSLIAGDYYYISYKISSPSSASATCNLTVSTRNYPSGTNLTYLTRTSVKTGINKVAVLWKCTSSTFTCFNFYGSPPAGSKIYDFKIYHIKTHEN